MLSKDISDLANDCIRKLGRMRFEDARRYFAEVDKAADKGYRAVSINGQWITWRMTVRQRFRHKKRKESQAPTKRTKRKDR